MTLASEHLAYLKKRGITSEDAELLYQANGSTLLIPYKDPHGTPYTDSKGHPFVVERQFPTSKPKFKAPPGSGSRPYFSPLMPEGYLDNNTIWWQALFWHCAKLPVSPPLDKCCVVAVSVPYPILHFSVSQSC